MMGSTVPEIQSITEIGNFRTLFAPFPEIWCVTGVIVISHFGLFFALLPPLTAQKIKILKN